VYLSQALQADGIRRGVEALRRNHPQSTGALYWQLDDNWPVLSWSSIDYHGRWKALHYLARRFFSPVLVSGVVEDSPDPVDLGQRGKVRIWGVNDLLREAPTKLQWSLARFDGTEVKHGEQEVVLPANRSTLLAELDFEKEVGEALDRRTYRKESYQNRRQYYVAYRLAQGERELSSNVSFFVPPKYLGLQPPGLRLTTREVNDRRVVDVAATRFAAFVHVGLREGYALFSDNDFHLLPGETRRIEVLSSEVPDGQVAAQLFARSLIDSRRGATAAEAAPGQP
jgi:beta-mannosidase